MLLRTRLKKELEEEVRKNISLTDQISQLERELELERARRVSSDAISAERRGEIERLREELRETRQTLSDVLHDRMKSLDALNVSLMEKKVEPPPPDLSNFKPAPKLKRQLVDQIRANERAVGMALIQKFHKRSPALGAAVAAVQTQVLAEGVGDDASSPGSSANNS